MPVRWGGRPKIADLLGRPEAGGVLAELRLARDLKVPPSILRGRVRQVTYLYDDPEHPDRATGHLESPKWTEDDRALLLALAEHEATLCPGCGHPKRLAWHSHMEGFYEPLRWVCHACTAQSGSEVAYQLAEIDDDLPEAKMADFPPFELGITTTDPSPSRSET